ncbi:TIGR00270 family protein [Candidatus Woesearchaeota archaeon]|nr:TIGR00270 family protein [Candidatus Woesearchaeota archaeon]
MPRCEMCGSDNAHLDCLVEGVKLRVCKSCSSFGKVLAAPKPIKKKQPRLQEDVPELRVVFDAAARIRTIREQLGLTQKEFAAQISERESIVHKLESKGFCPSLSLAKKLEKKFKVRLTEPDEKITPDASKKSSGSFTLGDYIKVR